MTNDKFLKNSYELLFQKVMKDKEDFRNMDYLDFIECLEILLTRLPAFSDIGSMMSHLVKHL